MFNLIMRWFEWEDGEASMPLARMWEYSEAGLVEQFTRNGQPDFDRLSRLPCLFMNEGRGDEISRVGSIVRPRIVGGDVIFECAIDPDVPPLQNRTIFAGRRQLDMPNDFEFTRNHWAIKDVDLYRYLLRNVRPRRQRPSVFRIDEHEQIEPTLVSVMMPFEAGFNPTYEAIRVAVTNVGLRPRRADDIWENPAIIQDVVSLIDRSRVVICDCTGRNPNVFYEAGIAHTLGREVILLTQSADDIPFDLRHLRYVRYLNNREGLVALAASLQDRLQTIVGH